MSKSPSNQAPTDDNTHPRQTPEEQALELFEDAVHDTEDQEREEWPSFYKLDDGYGGPEAEAELSIGEVQGDHYPDVARELDEELSRHNVNLTGDICVETYQTDEEKVLFEVEYRLSKNNKPQLGDIQDYQTEQVVGLISDSYGLETEIDSDRSMVEVRIPLGEYPFRDDLRDAAELIEDIESRF